MLVTSNYYGSGISGAFSEERTRKIKSNNNTRFPITPINALLLRFNSIKPIIKPARVTPNDNNQQRVNTAEPSSMAIMKVNAIISPPINNNLIVHSFSCVGFVFWLFVLFRSNSYSNVVANLFQKIHYFVEICLSFIIVLSIGGLMKLNFNDFFIDQLCK